MKEKKKQLLNLAGDLVQRVKHIFGEQPQTSQRPHPFRRSGSIVSQTNLMRLCKIEDALSEAEVSAGLILSSAMSESRMCVWLSVSDWVFL